MKRALSLAALLLLWACAEAAPPAPNFGPVDQPAQEPAQQGPVTIGFLVNGKGGAKSASITYTNENGDQSQDTEVQLPFSMEYRTAPGSFVYISAQNSGDSGEIVCTIFRNNVMVEQNTSSGAYAICQASGTA